MRRERKKNLYLALVALLLLLGVGYAAVRTTLKIEGTVDVAKASWDVHFENVQTTTGSVTANPAPTTNNTDTTEMSYTIGFTKPGDFYEFTVDIVNNGTIDAMIEDVSNKVYAANGTTEIQLPSYLTSSLTYLDGTQISQNHLLPKKNGNTKTVETIKVRIEFKKDIQASDLPSSGDTTIKFKFIGKYKQADENAVYRMKICNSNENITTLSQTTCSNNENVQVSAGTICKRAINLHQEECTQTSSTGYCSRNGVTTGNMITYGNCGTQGSDPVSGDAFTCDVNGDGSFDEITERFYYVSNYYNTSTKSFDNTTAVLIYYTNVLNGVSCNDTKNAYDFSNENWHGPVTLKNNLPTKLHWKNVSLKNSTRAILAANYSSSDSPTTSGGTLPTNFSYEGYAARLITSKELNSACGNVVGHGYFGDLNSCIYMLENTVYSNSNITTVGYWLETPRVDNTSRVWNVTGNSVNIDNPNANYASYGGTRPVIEVPKSKISY